MNHQPQNLERVLTIKVCNGAKGCRNAISNNAEIVAEIEALSARLGFDDFIRGKVDGILRTHHQIKIAISFCPNACSQPQIVDLGLIMAEPVRVTESPCTFCRTCCDTCLERAVTVTDGQGPEILGDRCLFCGTCAKVCPTQTIMAGDIGFRVLIGGKLGRHPRLAMELPGVFSPQDTLNLLDKSLRLFMRHYSKDVKRFADLFFLFTEDQLKKNLLTGA